MTFNDPIARKKALIENARRAAAKPEDGVIQKVREFIKPEDASSRIRIVFDNSGSMGDPINWNNAAITKMTEAKKGVIEFLRNCVPNKDAVAIHMLNAYRNWNDDEESRISVLISNQVMCTDLIRLASQIDSPDITPTGGTPLFETLESTLEAEPKATRIVAFSDGEANSTQKMGVVISLAKRYKIAIDTVFFGSANSHGATTLKQLAEETGGIFLAFDPAKGVSFASAFKYLTEGNRKLLMSDSFKAALERGEIK